MAARFPGPLFPGKYMLRSGLELIFPFYHAVSDQTLPHVRHLYSLRNRRQFEKDLEYLLKYFEPVSLNECLKVMSPGNLQKPRMVLSFDDGLIQCYEEIMPLLLKKGIPALFFLNNAYIDNRDLFFRYRVSLLLELLPGRSEEGKKQAAGILHCPVSQLRERLLSISYDEREKTGQLAALWNYSFGDYMTRTPVYLSSQQIHSMKAEGFEFGSHGTDHPLFSTLQPNETIDHISRSVKDLQKRFGLEHSYFAFPFTDDGVDDETINRLFTEEIIEAGFGTAGLKEDRWPAYFQRVPMEMFGLNARRVIQGELNRRRIRLIAGKNQVSRSRSRQF